MVTGSARRSRRPFGACQENSGSRDFRARLQPGGEVDEPALRARWWCRSRDRPGIAPEAARLLGVITRAAHAACARLPTLQNCRRALRPGGEANEPMLPPLRLSPPPCNRTAPWPHTGLIADLPGVGTSAVPTPPRRKIHIGVERRGAEVLPSRAGEKSRARRSFENARRPRGVGPCSTLGEQRRASRAPPSSAMRGCTARSEARAARSEKKADATQARPPVRKRFLPGRYK